MFFFFFMLTIFSSGYFLNVCIYVNIYIIYRLIKRTKFDLILNKLIYKTKYKFQRELEM